MRGLAALAAVLLCGGILATGCEPIGHAASLPPRHGKPGIDGGDDAGPPEGSAFRTVTVTIEGDGRVFSRYFDCSSTCTAEVPAGASFEIRAEGNSGFAMRGWTGPCAGQAGCRIEIDDDVRVGAVFAPAR